MIGQVKALVEDGLIFKAIISLLPLLGSVILQRTDMGARMRARRRAGQQKESPK